MMNIPTWLSNPPIWLLCLIGIAFGLYLARKAVRIGKNRNFWFLIGFFFGIYGVIAFWISKRNLKKQPQKPSSPKPVEPLIRYSEAFWYYLDEAKATIGPMSHSRINQLFQEGILHAKTLVWNEELENWKSLEELTQEVKE